MNCGRKIINDKTRGLLEETIVVYFKILSLYFCGATGENPSEYVVAAGFGTWFVLNAGQTYYRCGNSLDISIFHPYSF
jgi:hypothetical protein